MTIRRSDVARVERAGLASTPAQNGFAPPESEEFRLLSDQPSAPDFDQLGYHDTAVRLAETIKHSRQSTPLTIGIEGEWGAGKSTLMGCLQRALDEDPAIETIWFNAWTAEGKSALEGLIKSVLYKLDRNLVRRAARKTRMIGALRLALAVLGGWLGATRVADLVWDRANVDARTRNELRDLVKEAGTSWLNQYRNDGERLLVIFIDDLDRASPTQVTEVFEAAKLYLDVPGFVFVIGYDSRVLANAVADRSFPGQLALSRGYLEKIIQITYTLPPPDDEQAKRLLSHYTKSSNTDALFSEVERALVVDRNQRNPRRIKRFINAFVLVYGLDPEWSAIGPKSLVEVLLLEMHFPEFSNLFRVRDEEDPITEFLSYRQNREQLLSEEGRTKQETADALEELERELPEEYPLLVRSRDFVALVQAIRRSSKWNEVRAKLHCGVETTISLSGNASDVVLLGTPRAPAAAGSLLWIDDEPAGSQRFVEILERDGWTVTQVPDGKSAANVLRQQSSFDVIVSDCTRDGEKEAGLEEMRAIRAAGLHKGLVVFFTLRITPELRDRATALDAIATNKVEELLSAVRRAAHHSTQRK